MSEHEHPRDVIARCWRDGLTHRDWLFDGRPIRKNDKIMMALFENLDWSQARLDLGPSVAGNPGPYWHVPLNRTVVDGVEVAAGDTVHRLYPKLLTSKWGRLALHACYEAQRKVRV